MAGKRKGKRAAAKHEDLAKPSMWRLQHGGFEGPIREADPDTGSPVAHRRAVDTLGQMLANGTITPAMHEAGCIFRALFRSAAIDGMSTSQLVRLPGAAADGFSNRQLEARRRVAEALDALGGHGSPAGSCVWFVVGLEFSVREWAQRRGWSGRPVHGPVAQGMLVAALGTLAAHFRLTPRRRAQLAERHFASSTAVAAATLRLSTLPVPGIDRRRSQASASSRRRLEDGAAPRAPFRSALTLPATAARRTSP